MAEPKSADIDMDPELQGGVRHRPPMPQEDPPPYPAEHSLPTADEVRNNAAISGLLPAKNRRLFFLVMVSVIALVAIVGFSAGIAVSNRNAANPSTAYSSTNGGDGVSPADDNAVAQVDRMPEVQEFLGFVSNPADLQTFGTPQYQAALWIANKDGIQMEIPASKNYDASFPFVQRYVLALFYYAMDGDNWTYKQTYPYYLNGKLQVCE